MADQRLKRTSREIFLSLLSGGAPDLETWVIDRMTSLVAEEDVDPGKRLFASGELPEHIFFVREGRLRLERNGSAAWIFEGRSVVGVFDALLDRPHDRSAIAETTLHLLKLRVDDWLDLLEDSFGLARSAIGNALRTVADIEARTWRAQAHPRGSIVTPVPQRQDALSFVDRLGVFADVPLLRGAGIQVMIELVESMDEVVFEPGDSIIERGCRGHSFFVLEGEVEGQRRDPELTVHFGPGSFVGGVASLGDAIQAWEAHAETRVRTLRTRLEDWFEAMEEHFDLVRSTLTQLALYRETLLERLAPPDGELRVA